MAHDNHKRSVYFPEDMMEELLQEADRLDRPVSWVLRQAWRIARNEILRLPSSYGRE